MYTQVKSSNGITLVPMESRLLSDRVIFIEGEINENQAMNFVKALMVLRSEDAKKPIKILINTPGGEVNSGMLMYDVIQSCKTPLEMYCMGKAYSMGAVIFASGNKGKRYMLENSEIMVHEPLLGNRVGGNSSSIKSISESLLETKDKLNKILAKHTGKTEEEVEQATRYDHYFQAEEAVEFGLADCFV
ncbi:MAG: ATP-dependent Clp protease proteolytic subunit [Lachnospiraceae bacterium]|nr:ATP-dependent Clp protease proteolytic subunit [Lachnospiraceae bacterium]